MQCCLKWGQRGDFHASCLFSLGSFLSKENSHQDREWLPMLQGTVFVLGTSHNSFPTREWVVRIFICKSTPALTRPKPRTRQQTKVSFSFSWFLQGHHLWLFGSAVLFHSSTISLENLGEGGLWWHCLPLCSLTCPCQPRPSWVCSQISGEFGSEITIAKIVFL